jgi:PLP dependent protein
LKPHLQAMNGNPSLEQRYRAVKLRIERAAAAAGRDPRDVRLLAVSKTFSAGTIGQLASLGQDAFGENYLQEALAKITSLAHLRPQWPLQPSPEWAPVVAQAIGEPSLEWHFIGPIQSNKTRGIAQAFDWVQSVDSERIARRLSEQRPPQLPPLQVCLQVNVSDEPTKSGCAPDEVVPLAQAMAAMTGIRLRGLMAIPEPTDDTALQAKRFGQVRELFDRLRESLEASGSAGAGHLDTLSMGMSADLEAAIAAGATIVRVGSALFGERPGKN